MKKTLLLAAGAAALTAAAPASAATALTFASVTGPTGTVWDTDINGFYALFLQQPFGTILNPNDNFSPNPTEEGANNFLIAGDGFPAGTTANSDVNYTLTLRFADGATISGLYTFAAMGGQFVPGASNTATVGGTTYTLTGFGFDRRGGDNVSQFSAVSGGDAFDYTGGFAFNAVTGVVPEPTTWALFILGFGVIGSALRRRSSTVRVSKANLNFA